MRGWQLLLIDVALIGVALLVFALFDHVIPEPMEEAPTVRATMQPEFAGLEIATNPPAPQAQDPANGLEGDDEAEFDEEDDFDDEAEFDGEDGTESGEADPGVAAAGSAAEPTAQSTPGEGDFSQKFADKFTDGAVIVTDTTYQSPNLNVTLNRYEFKIGSYKEVAFVEDIYIRTIDCFRRCFADDTFGKAITESVSSMSKRCNAIAAINGDYYGHNVGGVVIRDGVMYRDRFSPEMQTLVLFRDGTMKCYRKRSEYDSEAIMAAGAWQSFSFGPALLDSEGQPYSNYHSTSHHPRTIVGMVEPGHYMFIVVDGRRKSYSAGMSYMDCAQFCQKLGLKVALNLDGGRTSQMMFNGKVANNPYKNGRELSDIVYVAEP